MTGITRVSKDPMFQKLVSGWFTRDRANYNDFIEVLLSMM